MKTIIFTLFLSFCATAAFTQEAADKSASTKLQNIKVPDFANPQVKIFYTAYADHLLKCVAAIREKDEAKATALFKNPGEEFVSKEKILSKEVIKVPAEKQKYFQFAALVYPYLKEVQQSAYYQKLYGK